MALSKRNEIAFKKVMQEQVLKFVVNKETGDKLDRKRLADTVNVALAIFNAMEDGHKEIQIQAPTGSGKSLLAFIQGLHAENIYTENKKDSVKNFIPYTDDDGERVNTPPSIPKACYIVTPRKSLQEQYDRDIKKFGLNAPVLKGQNSYPCIIDRSRTFAKRPCSKHSIRKLKTEMACAKDCPYLIARDGAINSNICVMNNHYLMTVLLNEHEGFKARDILIIDESHKFTEDLRQMYSVSVLYNIRKKDLIDALKQLQNFAPEIPLVYERIFDDIYEVSEILDTIDHESKGDDWIDNVPSIVKHLGSVSVGMKSIVEDIKESLDKKDMDGELVFNTIHTDEMKDVLAEYANDSDVIGRIYESVKDDTSNLIIDIIEDTQDPTKNGLKFSVMHIDKMYKKLFADFKHIIFMSATPPKTFFDELGVEDGKRLLIKSKFSTKTAPVIIPRDMVLSMSYKNRDDNFEEMFQNVEKICDFHLTKPQLPNNGFIHTGSYLFQSKMQEYFYNHPMNENFIWCDVASDIEAGMTHLEENPNEGIILVSPSILEGVDGKEATARFQIALKCPYPSMADRYIQRLLKENETLYREMVRRGIEQLIGRVQRTPKDVGITYLLDESFSFFLKKNPVNPHVRAKIKRVVFSDIMKVLKDVKLWRDRPLTKIIAGDYKGLYM